MATDFTLLTVLQRDSKSSGKGRGKKVSPDMKRFFIILLTLSMLALLLAGCGSAGNESSAPPAETAKAATPAPTAAPAPADTPEPSEDPVTVRLGGLKGPTSIGMVKLLSDNDKGLTANRYEYTLAGSADELTPKLLQGEMDIAAVPVNLGSVLWNNTQGAVEMLAVNTLGVVYIVERGGEQIQSMADLKGMTIYATGKGSHAEYALNYLLAQSGLDPAKDVTMEWKSEPPGGGPDEHHGTRRRHASAALCHRGTDAAAGLPWLWI
jgi:NitT/TauT family transport system substrate-binding protein